MVENNRIEWVDTDARKQLVEQVNELVEEVKMLRQHVADMYRAWMIGKAPPPPPPRFLDAVLTQTPDTTPGNPPHSPYLPAYQSFTNHPSGSLTHHPTIFSQKCPPCAPDDPPQCCFFPWNSQSRTSLSKYPAPQNTYPSLRAYRKPPRSSFWTNQAFKNERLLKKEKAFTPIGESYASLFQKLKKLGMLRPIQIKMPNPQSKELDFSRKCAYCSDAPGHDIERCWNLKKAIQKLIDAGDIIVQNPDATDTSQSPSHVYNKTHTVGMVYFEKKCQNSSGSLRGPRATKLSALSEVDLKNEHARGNQKQVVKNNVMETCEGPSIVDAKFGVAKILSLVIGKMLQLLSSQGGVLVAYFVVIYVVQFISRL